jgi:hypothetical protein
MKRFCLFLLSIAALNLGAVVMPTRAAVGAESSAGSITPTGSMIEPRSGHSATLLPDGRILVAGGMRRNQDFYRSAELYDPTTGRFQPTGQMSVARVGQAAVLLKSGKVLIAGGWVDHGCTDSAEIYDPATGKFTQIAKMTTRRGQPSATLLTDGDVLIAGGADHDTPGGIASAEIFHDATLQFKSVGSMNHARVSHTATLLYDGRVLIVGGRGENVTASAEIYDPKGKNFTLTGSMLAVRYKHTASLLPDGRVLVAGGSDDRDWEGTMNSAEIFDPRAAKFTATSPLHDRRFKLPERAVQLPSGKLLIAGGSKDVEVYDPNAGKFDLASGQLSDAWHFMTATPLQDGRVLLAGGYPNSDEGTARTWIYHP